jgi:hypothetical protein
MLAAQLKHAGQTVLECCWGDDHARPTDAARHRFPPCQSPDMVRRNGSLSNGRAVHNRRIWHGGRPIPAPFGVNFPKYFRGHPSFQSEQQNPIHSIGTRMANSRLTPAFASAVDKITARHRKVSGRAPVSQFYRSLSGTVFSVLCPAPQRRN